MNVFLIYNLVSLSRYACYDFFIFTFAIYNRFYFSLQLHYLAANSVYEVQRYVSIRLFHESFSLLFTMVEQLPADQCQKLFRGIGKRFRI